MKKNSLRLEYRDGRKSPYLVFYPDADKIKSRSFTTQSEAEYFMFSLRSEYSLPEDIRLGSNLCQSHKLYLKLLEMIDKNGDALNGKILAFIREHSLLPVMLLRQNQLAYLALGRLASDGYTIAQNDIAASLFAERNFDKSLWRKLTLPDDVWAEVVMVENSLLPVLEEKGVFGRITTEKFREILENAYDLEAKDELARLWRARFGNARLTPSEEILTPIDIFA